MNSTPDNSSTTPGAGAGAGAGAGGSVDVDRRRALGVTLFLFVLIAAFSIYLVNFWLTDARVDLTEQNLYSLTPGTEALLGRMQDEGIKPIEVSLFFSETTGKTLPKFIKEFLTYDQYIRSLLREYERGSDGRVQLDFIDPVPDSDEAQRAADLGLDGKLINQEGDLFYFGLSFETQTGSRQVLPFLWPAEQENVEYEISKALYGLLWPQKSKLGVLSSLEVLGSSSDPFMAQMLAAQGKQPAPKWVAIQLLEELYEVVPVDAAASEIPADLDLLVVIHPKDLPMKTLAAIDRHVVAGGNAMIFVDPYSLDDQAPQNPQQPWAALQYEPASDVGELFTAWGIGMVPNGFAADFDLAVRRPVQQFGPAESVIVDMQFTGDALEESVDLSSPIFRGSADLRMLLAGALETTSDGENESSEADSSTEVDSASENSELERLPLIVTTEAGTTLNIQPGFGGGGGLAYTDLNNPAKLRDNYTASGAVALAYLLRGQFPSAFPQGVEYPDREAERPPNLPPGVELPPPADAQMIRADPVAAEGRSPATVLVFADVDFIGDQIAFVRSPFGIVQAANDNHRVLLNSVDLLLGAEELMAIRSTKRLDRPFELFDDIEAQAEKDTLDREREIREDIETFQQQLRDKQTAITSRNASLFQKEVQDEVQDLNDRIAGANRELREIRKSRRQALERQESSVRFAVMGWMPIVMLMFGVWRFARRRT